MNDHIQYAIKQIEDFFARNEKIHPLRESLPIEAINILSSYGLEAAASMPLLIKLCETTNSYDFNYSNGRNAYDGQDLRLMQPILRAIAGVRSQPEIAIPFLAGHLKAVTHKQYFAVPGMSPDPDKYDRDADLEKSEDQHALIVLEVLAAYGPQAGPASAEIKAACQHRSRSVKGMAENVLKVIEHFNEPETASGPSALEKIYERMTQAESFSYEELAKNLNMTYSADFEDSSGVTYHIDTHIYPSDENPKIICMSHVIRQLRVPSGEPNYRQMWREVQISQDSEGRTITVEI